MTQPVQTQQIVEPQQGRALWHLGALMNFKLLGTETNGQFWAVEGLADSQLAVPLHVHSREDECWYIIEGEINFIVGETQQLAGAGTTVFIPRGVPHTFQIVSKTARWFGFGTPAGLDNWFFETGEPAVALTLPPPSAPPDIPFIISSLQRYGTDTLGPPPGLAP